MWDLARDKYAEVAARDGEVCYWCNKPVVRGYDVKKFVADADISEWTFEKVFFWDENGDEKFFRLASIDHVIPLSEGGESNLRNLVIACKQCNHLRSNKPEEFVTDRVLPQKPKQKRKNNFVPMSKRAIKAIKLHETYPLRQAKREMNAEVDKMVAEGCPNCHV
jgi:5-methylcytosine-specific restriction endonuclease McrA